MLYLLRLRQMTARLQSRFDVRIAERERIARELHDTLLQGFQGLMLQIKAGVNQLPDAAARRPLDEALRRAQTVLIEGRDRVRDLRAQDRTDDLAQALLDSAARASAESQRRISLTTEGMPREVHPLVLEEVQRIAEEAMRNVERHAKATSTEMLLVWGRRMLSLSIWDDGVGIAEEILAQGERPGHFGLRGMRERAQRIGGRLTIMTRMGGGTEVALVVPGRAAYRDHPVRRLSRPWSFLWAGRRRRFL